MPRPKKGSSGLGHPGRVTLQDIAAVAGVHVMTVSNALGDVRGVAPATREKVLRIAKELNYIPNSAARALVAGRTGMIAVVSGAIIEPYYASMVYFLERNLNADDYRLTLLRRPHDVIDLVNDTGKVAVDGAIGIDLYHWGDQFRAHPAVPCVSIGTYEHPFLDYVIVDLSAAIAQALRTMAEQGRKRIAYIVDAPHLVLPSEVRARTYLETMREIGMVAEIINVYTDKTLHENIAESRKNISDYLQTNGCPDAILCLNDEMAIRVFRVLRDLGSRVPDDVLLVGCDGQPHMEFFDPPLSTVSQPMEEMCAMAWRFLKQRIATPTLPLQKAVLQGELIARASLYGRK